MTLETREQLAERIVDNYEGAMQEDVTNREVLIANILKQVRVRDRALLDEVERRIAPTKTMNHVARYALEQACETLSALRSELGK